MRSKYGNSRLQTWVILGLIGIFTTACGGGGRDAILGTNGNVALAPTVTTLSPVSGAVDVAIDIAAITVTFNEAVEPLTGDASFTVTCEAPCTSPSGSVSLDAAGSTASFVPDAPLERGTVYTGTVTGARSQDTGLALAEPVSWTFTTEGPPPTVTAVAPVDDATGVAIDNTVITAQFSEPVSALAAGEFTVTCEAPCTDANGTLSMNTAGTIATFTVTDPTGLEPATLYTATITTASSTASGQTLAAPFVWSFTTGVTPDTTKPRVISTVPQTTDPGPTTGVPTNTAITATFSENMNPLTVDDASFNLTCELPCVSPDGAVTYVVGSRIAVFTPAGELESGVTYTATVDSSVTDLAGNQLAGNQADVVNSSDYIWSFTTEVALPANEISVQSTNPINGGNVVTCPAAGINATFDIPSGLRLDPATVNSLTFRVVENATPLNVVTAESVVVDVDTGTIMTFTPQNELTEGLTYRATLESGPNGVKDLALPANEMLEDFVWTFTAVAPQEPCVESPFPLNAAAPFGTFGGSAGVTSDGLRTIINGDVGTTGASTLVTGLVGDPECRYTITTLNEGLVNGTIFTDAPVPPNGVDCTGNGTAETKAIADQARSDANDAFIALSPAALPGGQTPSGDGENLGGQTLAPGVYQAPGGSFLLEGGDLTLDGQGDQNAVWVFQMASTLTVGEAAVPRSVILINGAQAKNVFWQVGTAATINPSGGGTMKGTIIAESGVSISTTGNNAPELIVTLDGRAISLTAAVTVVNTVINVPAP